MKNKRAVLICGLLPLVAAATILAGCDRLFDQKGEEALNMAQEKEREGDYPAAIQWYEDSLDGTPKTAESHYSIALILDDKLDNPVGALDHFRRYLELAPEGPHAADAKNFAAQDEFKLVNTLSKGNFMPQEDAARLKNQNFDLLKQLTDARQQIAEMRAEARLTPGRPGHADDPVQKPIPPGARIYTVEPGDTFRSISREFFHTSSRWEDIQDANFNAPSGTVKLKVGMNLIIPNG